MVTALFVFAVWFGLGAIGTAVLLGARTFVRCSRQRQDLPMAVDSIVARARRHDIHGARAPAYDQTAAAAVLTLADHGPRHTSR
jgi:hypothetical protein